jgi:hypothetical protein
MERALQQRLPDFLRYGQLFPVIYYATADKIPGQVVGLDSKQDSAIWSGHYLAAEAFHYALARQKKRSAHNAGQAAVWDMEMRRAKQRIDTLVAGAHRNINISKNWKAQGSYSPAFDGEAGILFRYSFPAGAPNWLEDQGPDRDPKFFGPIPWDDGLSYYCKGTPTRDQYTGCVLGLLMALDLVGPDDLSLQAQGAQDLMTMTDYLVRHGWGCIDPVTSNNDPTPDPHPLANGISWDLFMAQAARHAAYVAGTLEDQAKFEAIWSETLATFGPMLFGENSPPFTTPSSGYYGFNLAHAQYYNNIRLEPDPAVRAWFRQNFSMIDSITKSHGNSHFEAVTYSLSGDLARLDLSVQHLEQWMLYYGRWSAAIDMSQYCGINFQCIPDDQITYVLTIPLSAAVPQLDGTLVVNTNIGVGGVFTLAAQIVLDGTGTTVLRNTVWLDGALITDVAAIAGPVVTVKVTVLPVPGIGDMNPRADRVLRIADERTPQDFLWQRSPYNGSGGSDGLDAEQRPTGEPSGIDFLLPYYLLRYYTEVSTPAYAPWAEYPLSMQ